MVFPLVARFIVKPDFQIGGLPIVEFRQRFRPNAVASGGANLLIGQDLSAIDSGVKSVKVRVKFHGSPIGLSCLYTQHYITQWRLSNKFRDLSNKDFKIIRPS